MALAAAASASPMLVDSTYNGAAPILSAENAKEIPDSYMVMFKDHVTHNLAAAHHGWVNDLHTTTQRRKTELRKRSQTPFVDDIFHGLKHTYNIAGGLLGYSGHFDKEVIEQIRRHPDVSDTIHLKKPFYQSDISTLAIVLPSHSTWTSAHLVPGRFHREGPRSSYS